MRCYEIFLTSFLKFLRWRKCATGLLWHAKVEPSNFPVPSIKPYLFDSDVAMSVACPEFFENGLSLHRPAIVSGPRAINHPDLPRRHLTNRVQLVQVHIGSGTRSTVAEAGLSVPPRTRFSMRLLIVCRRFYRETARYL